MDRLERLEEVTLREHFGSRCDERTQGQNERLAALEKVVNEREKRYLDRFQSVDQHIARALAAMSTTEQQKEWSVGVIIAVASGLLGLVVALWTRFGSFVGK